MMSRPCTSVGARGLCVLVLATLLSTNLRAQTQTISLVDAMRIGVDRHYLLQRADIEAKRSAIDADEARTLLAPDLVLGVGGGQRSGRSFNQTEGRIVDQTTQSLSVAVGSSVNVFNGFRDIASLRRADFTHVASKLELQRAREDALFEVVEAFLTLVVWRDQIAVQREYLASEMELEQQIQRYVEAGARAVADLYQQQANVAKAKVDLIDVQSAADVAETELRRILRLDPAGVYDFQAPEQEEYAGGNLDLQTLLSRALAGRADLRAADARVKAAEQGVTVARSGYWPTLSLDTTYGSEYTDASVVSMRDQLDQQQSGLVSLQLAIPIFNRGATRAASRRARLDVLGARLDLEERVSLVGLQVRDAYLNYRAAGERLTAAEAQRQSAQRSMQTARERFKAGVYSLVELSQARANFVEAEGVLARARVLLKFYRVALDYHVGELDLPQVAE